MAEFRELVERLAAESEDREYLLRRVHNYVRDEIKFGWTAQFDQAEADYTLAAGRGHCVPQVRLFTALLRELGFDATMRFVEIRRDILYGTFPDSFFALVPERICHAYAVVKFGEKVLNIDSFIADPQYFFNARSRLLGTEREVGFGIHRDGSINLSLEEDSFCQFADSSMMLKDLGRSDSVDEQSTHITKVAPFLSLAAILKLSPGLVSRLNEPIEEIRAPGVLLESVFKSYVRPGSKLVVSTLPRGLDEYRQRLS
ncbi:MAG: transglutaminase-like domain-containing protein [Cyanobacteriota/Melainabacteria group bacterium]|nr:transglutaminase domain-containing protein [Cyanobacteria bacterium HKST-UBA01]